MLSDVMIGHSPHDGLYYCQYEGCQRLHGFSLECQLRKHTRIHTLPFKCKFQGCNYASAERKGLDRHIKAFHKQLSMRLWGPMEPTVCPSCKKSFTRKDNFLKHLKAKHVN
ncbi:unnamed protein product [Penicillium salamii]|nr:unnamed protein product [Penicillium salamii]